MVVVVEWARHWLTWRHGDVISCGGRVLSRHSGGGRGRAFVDFVAWWCDVASWWCCGGVVLGDRRDLTCHSGDVGSGIVVVVERDESGGDGIDEGAVIFKSHE